MSVISVSNLCKNFRVPLKREQQGSFLEKLHSAMRPDYQYVPAVHDLHLTIAEGESIALMGPSGAGKSTVLKMLSGILYPSRGIVRVLERTPWNDRSYLAYKIGVVLGQHSQLWPGLSLRENFSLLASLYRLKASEYTGYLNNLCERFEIDRLLNKTPDMLSLASRIRCEMVASLLHRPRLLFLDAPLMGLEESTQTIIRDFLKEKVQREGITLVFATQDVEDLEALSSRIVFLHQGTVLLEKSLLELKKSYLDKKRIRIHSSTTKQWNLAGTTLVEHSAGTLVLDLDLKHTSIAKVLRKALSLGDIQDIHIEDPPFESILQTLYHHGQV